MNIKYLIITSIWNFNINWFLNKQLKLNKLKTNGVKIKNIIPYN